MLEGNSTGTSPSFPALWAHANLIASAVVSALGTIATLRQNVNVLAERKTLGSRKEKEQAHLANLLDLLRKLDGLNSDEYQAIRGQVDSEVSASSRLLGCLTAKESELLRDPNYKLSFAERLFLLFPPAGLRAKVVHAFAYAFMFALPLLILVWSTYSRLSADMYSDLIVLTTFAGLGFRAWALAERRWAAGLETKPGVVTTLFLLNRPVNHGMRVAQVFLWICMFCGVESLEDIFFRLASTGGIRGEHLLFGPTVLFLMFMLGAAVCRAWGGAEFNRGSVPVDRIQPVSSPWRTRVQAKVWLLTIVYVAALSLPMLWLLKDAQIFASGSRQGFFSDAHDRIEFVFLWIALSVAGNRWLYLKSIARRRRSAKKTYNNMRVMAEDLHLDGHEYKNKNN